MNHDDLEKRVARIEHYLNRANARFERLEGSVAFTHERVDRLVHSMARIENILEGIIKVLKIEQREIEALQKRVPRTYPATTGIGFKP